MIKSQEPTQLNTRQILSVTTAVSIDYECERNDYVNVSPNATIYGNVHVSKGSCIGAGATVITSIRIGEWCTIGAGATVLHDIPDGATVVGVPVKIIKFKPGNSEIL